MKISPCNWILLILLKVFNIGPNISGADLDDWSFKSLGSPSLANITSKNSSLPFANLFEITPNGFNMLVEFLSDSEKKEITEQIKNRGRDNKSSDRVKIKFSELKCTIEIRCYYYATSIKLNGSSKIYSNSWFPLKVEFNDLDKKTVTCFEQHIVEDNDVNYECIVYRNLTKSKMKKLHQKSDLVTYKKPVVSFNIKYNGNRYIKPFQLNIYL